MAGGTPLTILGTGFRKGARVFVGTSECAEPTTVTGNTLSCTTTAGSAGSKLVTVLDPDNQQGTLADGFRLDAPPAPLQMVPATASVSGGATVKIVGREFKQGIQATIGAKACLETTFLTTESANCVVPVGTLGSAEVQVTNPDGQSGKLATGFSFTSTSLPSITAFFPLNGPRQGSTLLTISGSNFSAGLTVTVGGSVCTSPTVVDSAAPVIASIIPNYGPAAGNTLITVNGSAFSAGVSVLVGGFPCVSLTRVSDAIFGSRVSGKMPVGNGTTLSPKS